MFLLDQLPIPVHLYRLAERGNPQFAQRIAPGVEGVLGIRMSDLRALARKILQCGAVEDYLAEAGTGLMEERLLHALVLSGLPRPKTPEAVERYLREVERFLPRAASWMETDAFHFAGDHRFVADHSGRIWALLTAWMTHEREYEVRLGIVLAMRYFIDEAHILALLDHYAAVRHTAHYVEMAVAWAVAECYIRLPEPTEAFLRAERLMPRVHNLAIRKACESFRLDAATKTRLRALRRKG